MWKRLLSLFFVLVIFDGALRKWALPSQGAIIFFLKDAVLMTSFFLFWLSQRVRIPSKLQKSALGTILASYILAVLLQSLNPRTPTFGISILGIKSHLLYIILLILVPALPLSSIGSFVWVRRYALWAVVPISLLAVFQYTQPPFHWINKYISDVPLEEIATAGSSGAVRVTGTFSYISGMSTFVLFNLSLSLGLALVGFRSGGWRLWFGAFLLGLTLIVAPMTGSRAILYLPLVPLPILLVAAARKGVFTGRALVFAVFAIGAWMLLPLAGAAVGWTTFLERAQTAGDDESRVIETIWGPITKLNEGGFLGYGVGTAHQAAPQLAPGLQPYSWLPTANFEEENGRVGLELGILGFMAYLATKLAVCVVALLVVSKARNEIELVWGTTGFMFFAPHVVLGLVFNSVASAFYWGLAGIIVSLWSSQSRDHDARILSSLETRKSRFVV